MTCETAVPEIHPYTIVTTRQDHVNRFAVFRNPMTPASASIPWRSVNLGQGADSTTIEVRLDARDEPGAAAWTACDLVRLVFGRQVCEVARSGDTVALLSAYHLSLALVQLQRRRDWPAVREIAVRPGAYGSVYGWSVAALHGVCAIPLCPDPRGDAEGVTPELLLHVLDQLLTDAVRSSPTDSHLKAAARHVAEALREEATRMRLLHGPAPFL